MTNCRSATDKTKAFWAGFCLQYVQTVVQLVSAWAVTQETRPARYFFNMDARG
jgi:hypothetical protein